jgi:hypothetical protein
MQKEMKIRERRRETKGDRALPNLTFLIQNFYLKMENHVEQIESAQHEAASPGLPVLVSWVFTYSDRSQV